MILMLIPYLSSWTTAETQVFEKKNKKNIKGQKIQESANSFKQKHMKCLAELL